ncbi:hypothetical protein PoB_004698500 [Plakobranchus ocellatus]|uniref:Uncharacterized protein n=1 Tax=Plakobranchus ocellatus TaxID=259542 RepID=A0AAV4BM46_9GAST|nr:hypothetical protein PoB_004698500 [Plakobranchus ocellatus]
MPPLGQNVANGLKLATASSMQISGWGCYNATPCVTNATVKGHSISVNMPVHHKLISIKLLSPPCNVGTVDSEPYPDICSDSSVAGSSPTVPPKP